MSANFNNIGLDSQPVQIRNNLLLVLLAAAILAFKAGLYLWFSYVMRVVQLGRCNSATCQSFQ
ncbi:hypothetical protein K503DRAFT_767553 [Rhizopogon vinicolor AM-OR11-026]|uniref:Uncharacterized protein n=1 Tax=Rhizopogon vinicolor AM-OR11-026 TaxID=1314800 RepID=A0A1B7N9R3_9AGAM|nr:hypothetical protein K503DRAFT_767553 [Rhizopogon vinicolor AM-OR11-026]